MRQCNVFVPKLLVTAIPSIWLHIASSLGLFLGMTCLCPVSRGDESSQNTAWIMLVTDPLAAPLSCPCVQGYAQRNYEALAKYLQKSTGHEIELHFADSPTRGIEEKTGGRADIVIGKESAVAAAKEKLGLELRPVARLSGKDGSTTQTGLVVVRADDPAKGISDLQGYRILFGSADADEKHAAVLALLEEHGIPRPEQIGTSEACSDGACKIIEWGAETRAAAVISSYAKPLLEGCGTIEKGELRVVAETAPIPFITAFVNETLEAEHQQAIENGLRSVVADRELRAALETLVGFVPLDETETASENDTGDASVKKK